MWSYRIIVDDRGGEQIAGVHEVYFDESGNPEGWSLNPVYPIGITEGDGQTAIDELRDDLEMMLEAFSAERYMVVEDHLELF